MSDQKLTIVLGASPNAERYSNLAVKKLRAHGHPVVAVGSREGKIGDVEILNNHPVPETVDTVTLYLNPQRQREYYDYLIRLKPKRIIFNPGAENDELENLAEKNNIEVIEACTLVMLSTGQY